MPLYNQIPNLAQQNGSAQENYYSSLNRAIRPPLSANQGQVTQGFPMSRLPTVSGEAYNPNTISNPVVTSPMQPTQPVVGAPVTRPLTPKSTGWTAAPSLPTTAGQPNQLAPSTSSGYVMNPTETVRFNTQTGWADFLDPNTGQWVPATDAQFGPGSRRDPRLYGNAGGVIRPGYGTAQADSSLYYDQIATGGDDSGNGSTSWGGLKPEYAQRLQGLRQVEQLGMGGYNELRNPSQVRWDDEFGFVTDEGNIGADDTFSNGWDYLPYALAAGAGALIAGPALAGLGATEAGGAAALDTYMAGAAGAGTFPAAGAAAAGTGATLPSFAAGGGVDYAGATGAAAGGSGAAGSLAPGLTGNATTGFTASIPGTIPGSAITSAAPVAATAGGSGSALAATIASTLGISPEAAQALISGGGSLLSGYLGNRQTNQFDQNNINAANRADPFDPNNRNAANSWLADYLKDPTGTVTSSPLYRQGLDQLTRGINNRAAATGYLRTQNPNWDVAQALPGLTSQVINAYVPNMMQMAGANQSTAPAGNILAGGNQMSTSMSGASLNQYISGGSSVLDFLANWIK